MILIREPSNMPKDFLTSSVNAVQMALKSGRLSMARVEDAYNNIERLKARLRVVRPRTKIAGLAR
jgi:3'-phosphoadenosine 5'-phosphosulfate sulfotransferase